MMQRASWRWLGVMSVMGAVVACAESGGDTGSTSSGAGGNAQGGQGGGAQGGNAQGGTAQGGSAQGGSAQGGGEATDPACGAPLVAPSNGTCALDNDVLLFGCNPVTNEGCNDGEACDVSGQSDFACYPGNSAGICGACDQQSDTGPFCQASLTCFAPNPGAKQGVGTLSKCARYCCDDGDCGGGAARCIKSVNGGAWFPQTSAIGVCLE